MTSAPLLASRHIHSKKSPTSLRERITCHCELESSLAHREALFASHFGKNRPLFSICDSGADAPRYEKNDDQLSCFPSLDITGIQCQSPKVEGSESIPLALRSGTTSLKDIGTSSSSSAPSPTPPCITTMDLNGDFICRLPVSCSAQQCQTMKKYQNERKPLPHDCSPPQISKYRRGYVCE